MKTLEVLYLTFQEEYDYNSFKETKKNIQSKINFNDFIRSLKNSKLLTNSLCKNILEKSFLKDYNEFEEFIEDCAKDNSSFYIKYFYASILKTFKDADNCIENLDEDYLNDIYTEYEKYFDKKVSFNGYYLSQSDYIFHVTDEIFSNCPLPRFNYISKPKSKQNKNYLNKEIIEELLDGLDALTTDETSKDLLRTLKEEIFKK
mgnify:CR=1 FL=1